MEEHFHNLRFSQENGKQLHISGFKLYTRLLALKSLKVESILGDVGTTFSAREEWRPVCKLEAQSYVRLWDVYAFLFSTAPCHPRAEEFSVRSTISDGSAVCLTMVISLKP